MVNISLRIKQTLCERFDELFKKLEKIDLEKSKTIHKSEYLSLKIFDIIQIKNMKNIIKNITKIKYIKLSLFYL